MEEFSVTKVVLSVILVLGILFATCWVTGFFGLFYDRTIGVEQTNIQREKFENSTSYVKGMIKDLAKYKYEFETEKDTTSKKAIIDLIISKYSDFSVDKIEDTTLKIFLNDIKNGKYNNLEVK
jgi:hypothetical protein